MAYSQSLKYLKIFAGNRLTTRYTNDTCQYMIGDKKAKQVYDNTSIEHVSHSKDVDDSQRIRQLAELE